MKIEHLAAGGYLLVVLIICGAIIYETVTSPSGQEVIDNHAKFCKSKGLNFSEPFTIIGMSNHYECFDKNGEVHFFIK